MCVCVCVCVCETGLNTTADEQFDGLLMSNVVPMFPAFKSMSLPHMSLPHPSLPPLSLSPVSLSCLSHLSLSRVPVTCLSPICLSVSWVDPMCLVEGEVLDLLEWMSAMLHVVCISPPFQRSGITSRVLCWRSTPSSTGASTWSPDPPLTTTTTGALTPRTRSRSTLPWVQRRCC